MTLLYYDPIFLEHNTGDHPECAARLPGVLKALDDHGLSQQLIRTSWSAADRTQITRVHSADYLESLQTSCRQVADGRARIEQDTMISARSYDAAMLAAGAVCDAVRRVAEGLDKNAFCLVRPPGHHALEHEAMGFCLLNNVAVAAREAIDAVGLERVLIVDWDVHHGNGTQDAFWDDGRVAFLSMHRFPFYPGTGAASETGTGRGLGTTLNLPVEFGVPRREILDRFRDRLQDFAGKIRPQLVLISAGFDAHRADPIGSLGLCSEDFAELTSAVQQTADMYADGKIVSVLEGGYHPPALAESISEHVRGLIETAQR